MNALPDNLVCGAHHSNVHDDTITLLIIDDEPQIRRLVRNTLHGDPTFLRLGLTDGEATPELRVVEAASGDEGIDLTAAEAPALIILGLGLPDREGLAVCREVRRWSSSPLILLSARHADTEKAALLDAGADDYVTKPFSSVEFMARVRSPSFSPTPPPSPSARHRFGSPRRA